MTTGSFHRRERNTRNFGRLQENLEELNSSRQRAKPFEGVRIDSNDIDRCFSAAFSNFWGL